MVVLMLVLAFDAGLKIPRMVNVGTTPSTLAQDYPDIGHWSRLPPLTPENNTRLVVLA